jgi:hypothetical protein
MADQELTDLTETTTPASTDLIYIVIDPGGTPADRKATLATLATQLATFSGMTSVFVSKSLFDANTILAATADNTPVALTVGASTFLGRKAAGDISAMSVTEAGTLLGAYTSYTPTITQGVTITTSSLTANYCQIGKHVHAYGACVVSNSGTSGQGIGLTLPVTPQSLPGTAGGAIGVGMILDASATWYKALVINDGPGMVFYNTDTNNGASRIGAANGPQFGLVSGDSIQWDITYQAA